MPPSSPPPPPFSAILSYLTKTDIEYSSRIHRSHLTPSSHIQPDAQPAPPSPLTGLSRCCPRSLSLGWLDYVLAVPGVICSSACVPGLIALTYLSTSIPLGIFTTITSYALTPLSPSHTPPTTTLSLLSLSHTLLPSPPLCSVSTVLVTEACKKRTHRDRPAHGHIHLRRFNLRSLLTNFSFPSGDSAQSAVLGLSFFLYCTAHHHPWAWLWLLLLPVVMFSRVYFGCHWIGDVLVGASIGGVVTAALWGLWVKLLQWPMVHAAGATIIKEVVH